MCTSQTDPSLATHGKRIPHIRQIGLEGGVEDGADVADEGPHEVDDGGEEQGAGILPDGDFLEEGVSLSSEQKHTLGPTRGRAKPYNQYNVLILQPDGTRFL
jgi:hypothetical protein